METTIKGIELAGSLDREKIMKVFWNPKTQISMIGVLFSFIGMLRKEGKPTEDSERYTQLLGSFKKGNFR